MEILCEDNSRFLITYYLDCNTSKILILSWGIIFGSYGFCIHSDASYAWF